MSATAERRKPGRKPMHPEGSETIRTRVTPPMRAAIRERAAAEGVTDSEVNRRALAAYLADGDPAAA